MPTVSVAGGELGYERGGAGEPLLLIQGMSGTRFAWGEPFLAALQADFDCVAFDNRGVGGAAAIEPFTIADMAGDALGVLDALEIERAHVLGISMGGMIAQELALAHRDRLRSLTIGGSYCGGPGSQLMDPDDFRKLAEAMASGERERILRASWEINVSPGFRAEETRYEEFVEMVERAAVPRAVIQLQLQAIAAHDTSSRLADITTPTMVVHGTVDRVLGFPNGELIASLIPAARLEVLEDVGHMFWWEQPQRSAELLRSHALAAA